MGSVLCLRSEGSLDEEVERCTEQERWDPEPSGLLAVKANLASHALRCLSRRDGERSWTQLRCELETQSGLWERLNSDGAEGLLVQLKSQIDCGLDMGKGGCNGDAIVALEAALMTDAAAKHISRHVIAIETKAMEAPFSKARLSPRMKACIEEVLAQMRVNQSRHDLSDYLDMVSSLDDSRLDTPQRWFLDTAKACDLKYGVLKEYLYEVFAADAQLLAERNVIAANGCKVQPSPIATTAKEAVAAEAGANAVAEAEAHADAC